MLRTGPKVPAIRFLSLTHFLLVILAVCVAPAYISMCAAGFNRFPMHFPCRLSHGFDFTLSTSQS